MAHVRSWNADALVSSRSSCLGPDCTRSSTRLRSPSSTATAARPLVRVDADHHRHWVLLVVERVRTVSSQATAKPDGKHLVRKPSRDSGRQTVRELCHQGLSRRYELAAPSWSILNQTDRVSLGP